MSGPITNQVLDFVHNAMSMRRRWIESFMNPTCDVDKECGYVPKVTPEEYRRQYDRNGIAKRVVNIYPEECWEEDPIITDDEDPDKTTPFEEAIDELNKKFGLWRYLQRADRLAGIGRFGLLLIGLDDGLDPRLPVEGLTTERDGQATRDHKIIYLRVVSEEGVEVSTWNQDPTSPRYGRPDVYTVRFATEEDSDEPVLQHVAYHWTRVIHIADNLQSSEIYGEPRMQDVFNWLCDIKKIAGASGVNYWRGSVQGMALETLPGYEDATFDREALNEELRGYEAGLQRTLALEGIKVNTLDPDIKDPAGHIRAQIMLVAAAKGIPYRILMGAEEAKLASDQDSKSFRKRVNTRNNNFVIPTIVRPFIDRAVALRIIPEPSTEGYEAEFPDMLANTEMEKAELAAKQTDALTKYVTGGVDALIEPMEYFVHILGLDEETAKAIIEAVEEHEDDEDMAMAPMDYFTQVLGLEPNKAEAIIAMAEEASRPQLAPPPQEAPPQEAPPAPAPEDVIPPEE